MTKIGLFSLADHLADPVTGQVSSVRQRLCEVIQQGVLAEQVGFERFAVGEHHFTNYLVPNANLLLSALAARTERIRLFTTVTLLAYRHAIQLAEDVGVLDQLSNGRIELSVARGVTFEGAGHFGVTEATVYRDLEHKLVELLHVLRGGELEPGEFNRVPLTVVPRPIQSPAPPIWIGGGLSEASCDVAVKFGLPLILPSLFRHPEDYQTIIDRYRNGMLARGWPERIRLGMPNYCWVAKTSQAARAQWRPRLEQYVAAVSSLRGSFGRDIDFESLMAGPAICGSPAEVVDRIGTINQQLGLDNHILLMDVGGIPFGELRDALELMGSDVLPHFQRANEPLVRAAPGNG
ncbi:MAG TPA: LLM class flavin-dependent oxidoreductase [Polyangiaceae bacterium]|nr:LLM class flavin-dependent oxidoreductase [Polyangiaceae bacterium]